MEENLPSPRPLRRWAPLVLATLLIIGSFAGGFFVGRAKGVGQVPAGEGQVTNREAPPPYLFKDVDFNQFWNVWKLVKEKYVGQPVSDVKMFYGAMAGMVAALGDPYSIYLDPEFADKFSQELSGTFEGIGAEIGVKKNQLTVIAPLSGTPAERAGLKSGDHILAIDGADTTGMTVEEAVTRIRGKKGTEVKLMVIRETLKEPKEIAIVRDAIVVVSVKWSVKEAGGKKIGVITISHFNDDTTERFNQAVREVLMQNIDGLALDLRNDPGGFLETAIDVAGEWIHEDVVVVEKFSDGQKKDYLSDGLARLADVPTVVLVNGGSASASEIVAGALQDYGKAKLVGEKTFGKGSVQDYMEFDDGSALKVSIALWLTPKGRSINQEGIAPDVEVKMTEEDYDADRDPQMDKALELLSAKK
ncbi:PDZ domain-containing protein [Candidatus Uhrbacteria bacterium]|nr:PDZ domain-containing protein [Candidatus Uhrbacteria bacterium]